VIKSGRLGGHGARAVTCPTGSVGVVLCEHFGYRDLSSASTLSRGAFGVRRISALWPSIQARNKSAGIRRTPNAPRGS